MSLKDARRAARADIYAKSQLNLGLQDILNQDFTDNSEIDNIVNTNLDTAQSRLDLNRWKQAAATTMQTPIIQPKPAATIVTPASRTQQGPNYDEMSFNDAFALARKLHGANGNFMWKGKLYGTKYANETTFTDWEPRATPAQTAQSVQRSYNQNLRNPSLSGMSPWL